ncbi:MAG: hypothetical protein FP820_05305 [Sulfurimonas sp.]|nr:hypothetical protein [Sulfurimonas sp.]MBU3939814.1 hypothetical protein [bacterium]MBU4025692.1 hypothetical protein [bacterium]MBU4059700.1 hypothetical protein [bacterium]
MKYLAGFIGLVAVVIVGIYVLAFTPFGNAIVAPIIESKIQQETKLESKLTTFRLSMSDFELVLELNPGNTVQANGNFSLFSKVFDVAYRVRLDKLNDLQTLTQTQLVGTLFTEGTAKGDMAFMTIEGVSDLAKSETTYHVELTELSPTSIIAKVKQADLLTLLGMIGQKPYASAQVDLDVDFKNIMPHALDGMITLQTQQGKVDTKLMKSDFNVTMPEMAFSMNLNAKLERERIDYDYALSSNLAKITSSGKVLPEPLSVDLKYGIDVQELAVFKPITNGPLRGPMKLYGNVKGTKESMKVDGKSDFSGSDTSFQALLKDFEPITLEAKMKNLKLEKVLYMLDQPHYADGVLSLDVDLSDARSKSLKGSVKTTIINGLLDSKYMSKAYAFKSEMPRTIFDLTTSSVLNANIIDTKVTLNSNLATLNMQKVHFDMSDASLSTDYKLSAQNLDAFYFATQRHMRGGIVADGVFKQAKDLDLSIHSNIAGGTVEANLHNDDFKAELKSLQTLKLLNMFIYPEIFQASMNGTLTYNLLQEKGNLNANLLDGVFTKNEIFTLIKQYGVLDMYEERFKGEVNANINKEFIVASLELLSNKSSIKTKNTKLNSKTKEIDSNLDLVVNNNPISASIKGRTDAPKVSVDLEKFMKSKAGDAVKKEVNKFLKGLF